MFLPDEKAIRAKAVELGHTGDGPIPTALRAAAADALTAEQNEQPDTEPDVVMLSRSSVQVADGYIVVEVTHRKSL